VIELVTEADLLRRLTLGFNELNFNTSEQKQVEKRQITKNNKSRLYSSASLHDWESQNETAPRQLLISAAPSSTNRRSSGARANSSQQCPFDWWRVKPRRFRILPRLD